MTKSALAALLLAVLLLAPGRAGAEPTLTGKKLLQYGWDSPDTAYYRKNLKAMERSPFDGILLTVRPAKGEGKLGGSDSLGWLTFGSDKFKPEQYQHAIEDLQASKSSKFTDNFIAIISQPPATGLNWFDDAAWATVAHNVRAIAHVAKQGGCAGIMFDPEEYAHPLWSYARLPESWRKEHTYAQHVEKVRQRGREFAKAVDAEFPGATILTLFGPYLFAQNVNWIGKEKAAEANYSLLGPFYDGILEAAADNTLLVDGYEHSYGYKSEQQFKDARGEMIDIPKALSAVPNEFAAHVKVGFGLWLDNNSGQLGGWFKPEEKKNYFTPQQWQQSVHHALMHTDKYVWIYNERARWWDATPGEAYVNATQAARDDTPTTSSAPRTYNNQLKIIENPQPLIADHPEWCEPIRELRHYEAPALVQDSGADLDVRAWRYSYNARGIIEMPNSLRAADTAIVVVHPWGIDDGQGWKTPEPAGIVDFCTPEKNKLASGHTRTIINPFLKKYRSKVGLVVYSLPGDCDPIRKKMYRSFAARPTEVQRREGAAELKAKLSSFTYRGQPLPQSLTVSGDRPTIEYFQQFSGLDAGDRYNNAGFWELPIPVTKDIDVETDDVVAYDNEGYEPLKKFLQANRIRHGS
ncbi:MAG TPA: hypothetical protein VF669_16755 [Tepidisphaeraceae bacterium]